MSPPTKWISGASGDLRTARRYERIFVEFGLGVESGGYLGSTPGTLRQVPDRDPPRIAVIVPDDRVGETEDLLGSHGVTAIDGVVTHDEHPQRRKAGRSET